jgi:hypothetical protein
LQTLSLDATSPIVKDFANIKIEDGASSGEAVETKEQAGVAKTALEDLSGGIPAQDNFSARVNASAASMDELLQAAQVQEAVIASSHSDAGQPKEKRTQSSSDECCKQAGLLNCVRRRGRISD